MKAARESRSALIASPLFPMLLATLGLLATACGEYPTAKPAAAEVSRWEGIGIWNPLGESAPLSSAAGIRTDSPNLEFASGGVQWRVVAVEDLNRGIAQTWPSIEYRWVVVRFHVTLEGFSFTGEAPLDSSIIMPADSGARRDSTINPLAVESPAILHRNTLETRVILPGNTVVMVDDGGGRHPPNQLHARLYPDIHSPLIVDSRGLEIPLVFSLKRDRNPVGVELHTPLGDGRLFWRTASPASRWVLIDRKIEVRNERLRRGWEARLVRARFEPAAAAPPLTAEILASPGDSLVREPDRRGFFEAEIVLRNLSAREVTAPDPDAIRLFLGTGRTLKSLPRGDTLPLPLIPGGASHSVMIRFPGAEPEQSAALVVPLGEDELSFDAWPGFLPEKTIALVRKVAPGGLVLSLYELEKSSGEFRIRFGVLKQGGDPVPSSGLSVLGLVDGAKPPVPGRIENSPDICHPEFEERRWAVFPESVKGARFLFPGREPVDIWW